MKIMQAVLTAFLLLHFGLTTEAGDGESGEGWGEFGEFVDRTYLFPIAWDDVRKSVPEGLPDKRKWELRTELANRRVEKLKENRELLIKVYGYAVGNQIARSPEGSVQVMFARQLRQSLADRIPHYARLACEGENPSEAEIARWEKKLRRLMTQAVDGDFDSDLKRLTEVDPKDAPDFFVYRCRRILTPGEWQWWEWTNDKKTEGRVADLWKLSLADGAEEGEARRVSDRQPSRRWRLVDGFLVVWLAQDGSPEVVFLLSDSTLPGTPLTPAEKKDFALNGRFKKVPSFGARSTVHLQRAMDPDDPETGILGEWEAGSVSGDKFEGENLLRIRIEPVPGQPGRYSGKIVALGGARREAHPGGVDTEILRLTYRAHESDMRRVLKFDVWEYYADAVKHGSEPWRQKPWIRLIGKRLSGPETRTWLRE